jgi:acyl-CoA reductase-like NAD-dependent aldehyde dehydrogenase
MQDFKMLISGEERAAVGGEWIESINPYTGKVWAR